MTIEIGLSKLGIRFINNYDENNFGCFDMDMQGWAKQCGFKPLQLCNCYFCLL
jgi:hypothetical protein